MVRKKSHSMEQEPHSARLFGLLDPCKFTLLYVNITVPEALHAGVEANLAPWRDLRTTNGFGGMRDKFDPNSQPNVTTVQ
jgi:hypothetical protein